MSLHRPFAVLLVSAILCAPGCAGHSSNNLQSAVGDRNFLPLSDFDLIQFVPSTGTPAIEAGEAKNVQSQQVVLGSVVEWNGLTGGPVGPKVLVPVRNPLQPSYSFNMRLERGPQEIVTGGNGTVDVDFTKLGKWASAGFKSTGSAEINSE